MPAVATTTILPYAKRSIGSLISLVKHRDEATKAPEGHRADTVDADQVIPPTGSQTAMAPAIPSPAVLPVVHPPAILTIPIAGRPPSSTHRTASM